MSTYCVPDLKLYLIMIDRYKTGAKFNPDGKVVHWLKPLVSELEKHAGFPDPYIFLIHGFKIVKVK
jgi:hypothetical protein